MRNAEDKAYRFLRAALSKWLNSLSRWQFLGGFYDPGDEGMSGKDSPKMTAKVELPRGEHYTCEFRNNNT